MATMNLLSKNILELRAAGLYDIALNYGKKIDRFKNGSVAFTVNGYRIRLDLAINGGYTLYNPALNNLVEYYHKLVELEQRIKEISDL